jgi:hypothetical protein
MQALSSLLNKSKKQSMFQQAYIFSKIKTELVKIQNQYYPTLVEEFQNLDVFIAGTKDFVIRLKTDNISFKSFLKTEIGNIETLLQESTVENGIQNITITIKLT